MLICYVMIFVSLNHPPLSVKNTCIYGKKSKVLVHAGQLVVLLYTQTFTQQKEHCDLLIFGHVPLMKFKCFPTGIQLYSCCPRAEYNST